MNSARKLYIFDKKSAYPLLKILNMYEWIRVCSNVVNEILFLCSQGRESIRWFTCQCYDFVRIEVVKHPDHML